MVPQPFAASIMRSASTTFVVIGFSMKVATPARIYGSATSACFSLWVAIRTPSNLAGAFSLFAMTVTETPGKDSKVRSIFRPHRPCPTRPSRRFTPLFARLKATRPATSATLVIVQYSSPGRAPMRRIEQARLANRPEMRTANPWLPSRVPDTGVAAHRRDRYQDKGYV